MANDKTPETVAVPIPANMSMEQFAQLMAVFTSQITSGISAGINEARPRKIAIGQYDPKTPFHPVKKKASKLTRPCYQNGTRLNPAQLHDREIDLLNQVNRSGRYINRLIEVVVMQDGSDEVIELRYKNKTIDDRMDHRGAYRDLTDMLQQIVKEQDVLNAEEGILKEQRKAARESFSSAATREARARVAAQEASIEP